jgi:glycosyltransferase involved in cell wall biosynthesis
MKILHVCLASHYTEGLTYQDNILPNENAKDGHDVMVISDCFCFIDGVLTEVLEEKKVLSNGIHLIRKQYDCIINKFVSSKIRKVSALREIIIDFKPDVILFHGVAGWEKLTVADYKKQNPSTKLYIDSHEDFNNSGTNFISYFFQYLIFNRFIVNRIKKYVDKFLYVTLESKYFLSKAYGLENDTMEFYPLGGNILSENSYITKRDEFRKAYTVSSKSIVFLQTGKFDHLKQLIQTLHSFTKTTDNDFKYLVAGSMPDDTLRELKLLIKSDSRIEYIGWINAQQLEGLLCAADVYVQPGPHQSATMQMSLCARCPVIFHDLPSHRHVFNNNGWLVKTQEDVVNVFLSIEKDREQLIEMSNKSYEFAREWLDYSKLAKRILQ